MALSAIDAQRVTQFATHALHEKTGQNINKLTADAKHELGIHDVQGIHETLVAKWNEINDAAGLGGLKRFTAGPAIAGFQKIDVSSTGVATRFPKHQVPQAVLSTKELNAAGTPEARVYERNGEAIHVHGPEYWDFEADKGRHNAGIFRFATQGLLRFMWVLDDGSKKLRGISGAEIEALTGPGPNGEPPALRPGDCLINGGGGDPSHVALYAGIDENGRPMIIHSMATNNEGRSRLQRLNDILTLPVTESKTGVLYEPLAEFFDRYHRDTVIITRWPDLTPAQIEKGLARAHELIGEGYDYKLNPGTVGVYCTEVFLEFLRAALDNDRARLPYMGTSYYSHGTPLRTIGVETNICEPAHVAASPHMEIGAMLGNGAAAIESIRRTHVLGPNAARKI
jgi:hypothetical protein